MAIFLPFGNVNGVMQRTILPGDVIAGGEALNSGSLATAGSGTWTGAEIATGIIYRTGPSGAYTDTTDTASNIITAVAGNAPAPAGVAGTSFRLLFVNSVAFAHTFAAGVGVITGSGVVNAAASTWREYLVTILNAMAPISIAGTMVSNSATVAFMLPPNTVALSIGPASTYNQLDVGAGVNAASGLATGSTVAAVTFGVGGITGIVMSNTASVNQTIPLNFTPAVKIDGLRSGTL